jgi:hypothetical protein
LTIAELGSGLLKTKSPAPDVIGGRNDTNDPNKIFHHILRDNFCFRAGAVNHSAMADFYFPDFCYSFYTDF